MPGIDTFTKLMIHSDTSDGSTVFTDSSPIGRTVTLTTGSAHHETDAAQFGASSIYFPGSSYLRCASSVDFAFGTGDFTIDFWTHKPSLLGNQYFFDLGSNGCAIQYNGGLLFYNSSTGLSSPLYTTKPAFTINTWYHVAVTRSSGTTRLFLDGVLVASGTDTRNYPTAIPTIGAYGTGSYTLNGYIDEFRVDKGIARWTETFTPPTAPYSIAEEPPPSASGNRPVVFICT